MVLVALVVRMVVALVVLGGDLGVDLLHVDGTDGLIHAMKDIPKEVIFRALEEFVIDGPTNLLGFHLALLETPCFVSGGTCNGVVESEQLARRAEELQEQRGRRSAAGCPLPDR